jgi:hypothetical protein
MQNSDATSIFCNITLSFLLSSLSRHELFYITIMPALRNTLLVNMGHFVCNTVTLLDRMTDMHYYSYCKTQKQRESNSYIKLPTVLARENASNEIEHRH